MTQTSRPWADGEHVTGRVTLTDGGRVLSWEPDYDALNRLMVSLGLAFYDVRGPFGNPCFELRRIPSNAPMLGGQTPVLSGDEPMLGGDRREKRNP